nr:retrovirus-related Pol polyprotein from transposon TNT 1-94 [Tanacetum cinerariifolium]
MSSRKVKSQQMVKKLRTDNGFEFCNRKFKKLCVESGITKHLAVAETPLEEWAEATCTVSYLINSSPSTAIEKKTPMELWSGHPSDYGMLRIFGCVAYPHDKQGADKSVEKLQVEVELMRLNSHTPEEDQIDHEDGDVEDAGNQEIDQTSDLTYYLSKWKASMKEEMYSLRKNKTWELVDHPAGQKLVSCKWLFKIKERIEGVQKPMYKARLVARGFTQKEGIDYNEIFSLIIRHTSIRVILALTTCKDYELEQLDVKTAFLHENLVKVIYMSQPSGYEQGNKVRLLKKSLYGLKQSPR